MSTLERARFTFDESPDFAIDGYHDPDDTWNGWCKPYVTAEVAATLAERLAGVTYVPGPDGVPVAGTYFKWFPRTAVLVEVYYYDDAVADGYEDGYVSHECMLATRDTVDGPLRLYPIASGLCWTPRHSPETDIRTTP
jgi:hypothetical protein